MSDSLIPAVVRPPAGFLPGVHACTTTRRGGLSAGGYATANLGIRGRDARERVLANRLRIVRLLDLPAEPTWLRQVHGTDVVALDTLEQDAWPEVDAAWTGARDRVCVVLTADCLPVVLADGRGRNVAVAHAGWRGLAAGVLEAAVVAMAVPPDRAWLGPCIGPDRFEVGPEVRAAFVDPDPGAAECFRPGAGDRWFADLPGLARRRLHAAGITRVAGGDRCTLREGHCFFSHRRDGPDTGRMATLVWRA